MLSKFAAAQERFARERDETITEHGQRLARAAADRAALEKQISMLEGRLTEMRAAHEREVVESRQKREAELDEINTRIREVVAKKDAQVSLLESALYLLSDYSSL